MIESNAHLVEIGKGGPEGKVDQGSFLKAYCETESCGQEEATERLEWRPHDGR